MKPKEETKPIEDKSNNQSKAAIMFKWSYLQKKKILSELHDSIDYNTLKLEYVGPTKDLGFYEYKDSKELFNTKKITRLDLVR